jgi:hypothetical protein
MKGFGKKAKASSKGFVHGAKKGGSMSKGAKKGVIAPDFSPPGIKGK